MKVVSAMVFAVAAGAYVALTAGVAFAAGDVGDIPLEDHVLWQNRRYMVEFGLGPAPFPDAHLMDYQMTGDAHTDYDSVRLTESKPHQRGAIWSKQPNRRNNKEWMAELTFRVGGSPNKDHFGDGFGFWLTHQRNIVGHAMGGPDQWHGLGVFFDTYKNDGFKGKKHPYVYAYINDGTKRWEDIKGADVSNQACHVPFRNKETSVEKLAVTTARMTFKDNIFSVVMRPKGSDDWVQCFQMKNVNLPTGGYFGVTSLTGDLVDNHHMMELSVFSNIEHQPYDHAHENDIGQMPEMWDDMRHSGEVAREFEEWEAQFEDQLKMDPFEDDYTYSYNEMDKYGADTDDIEKWAKDDYYEDPYAEASYTDEEEYADYEESDNAGERDYYEGASPKGDKKSKTRSRRKVKPRKKDGGDDDDDDDVVKDMSRILERSEFVKEMKRQSRENHARMHSLRLHLEGEVKQVVDRLSEMLRTVRRREQSSSDKIAALGRKFDVQLLEPFELLVSVSEMSHHSWKWPFVLALAFLLGFSALGYSKYRRHMKTHLL